jgi:hypothetical protein
MAEWFARTYGMDVMKPESAGLQPAGVVAEMTKLVMQDKNITMVDPIPKGIAEFNPDNIDLIVNISGFGLPKMYRSKDIVTTRRAGHAVDSRFAQCGWSTETEPVTPSLDCQRLHCTRILRTLERADVLM